MLNSCIMAEDFKFQTTPPYGLSFQHGFNEQPLMKIYTHSESGVLLEINNLVGKSLTVYRDGTVAGDLAVDEAAIQFWKAIGKAYPNPR